MAAFAADEADYPEMNPPQTSIPQRINLAKQALAKVPTQQLPPMQYHHEPDTEHHNHINDRSNQFNAHDPPGPAEIRQRMMASTPIHTSESSRSKKSLAGSAGSGSGSHSPTRVMHHGFNPTLPTGMPSLGTASASGAGSGVSESGIVAIGAKRPLVQDYEMEEPSGSAGVGSAVTATPSRRASKRRGLGGGREEDRDGGEGPREKERDKGKGEGGKSRGRKGHGHGHGHGHGGAGAGAVL
jgi:hypothetical protein